MADVPPFFEDLGKSARDTFNKGFDFPKVKLSLKTKTESGVEFETNGSHDLDKSKTFGNLKAKLKFPDQGVTFTESWNTASELNCELNYEPKPVEGLKLTLDSTWVPTSGQKSGKLKTSYKREYVSVDADADLQMSGPVVRGSSVLMYKGWYAGYQIGYNTSNAKLTANDVAMGYSAKDFTFHLMLKGLADATASLHHKLNNSTEVALMTAYSFQAGNPSLAVSSKYTMNDGGVLRAKVNNAGQVALGYSQNLRDGVKVSFSTLIEGKNISSGGHKMGLALDFES